MRRENVCVCACASGGWVLRVRVEWVGVCGGGGEGGPFVGEMHMCVPVCGCVRKSEREHVKES